MRTPHSIFRCVVAAATVARQRPRATQAEPRLNCGGTTFSIAANPAPSPVSRCVEAIARSSPLASPSCPFHPRGPCSVIVHQAKAGRRRGMRWRRTGSGASSSIGGRCDADTRRTGHRQEAAAMRRSPWPATCLTQSFLKLTHRQSLGWHGAPRVLLPASVAVS